MVVNAVGSAVLPGKTRTATGRPAGSVNSPYSIWGSPFLPSREYPRAASGQHRPVIQEEDRSNRASRSGLPGPVKCVRTSLVSMASCRPASQSIAAYTSSVVASATPRSSARVVSAHHRVVASFEAGRHTRAMISANAMSRSRPAGPSKAGRPSALAWVRAGTGHLQSFTGDHQRLAGQRGPHRLDRGVWQWGQVGQRLVLDLAAVTVGAAQQLADVLAWLTGLVDAPIRDRGYVHRTRRLRHSKQRTGESQIVP